MPRAGRGGGGGGPPAGPSDPLGVWQALQGPWPSRPVYAATGAAAPPGARPPFCDPLAPGRNRGEAVVEFAPRGVQGGAARGGAGPPSRRPGAPYDGGFRGPPSCQAPVEGAAPADTCFQGVLGMAVGFLHGLRRLAAVLAGPEVGWPRGAPRRDGTADGPWAVRPEADQRPLAVGTPGPEPDGPGGVGRGPHTARQQNVPGAASPEAPEPLMADVRGEALERQEAPALDGGDPRQAGGRGARAGPPCVVARAPRRDRPRGDGQPAVAPVRMDCGEPAGRRGAQGAPPARTARPHVCGGKATRPSAAGREGRWHCGQTRVRQRQLWRGRCTTSARGVLVRGGGEAAPLVSPQRGQGRPRGGRGQGAVGVGREVGRARGSPCLCVPPHGHRHA
jgi:hypothetical protein